MSEDKGQIADITVRILRQIRDENRETNVRLEQLRADTREGFAQLWGEAGHLSGEVGHLRGEMREGFEALRDEMHEGFDTLGQRIDNVLRGEHREEHVELRERVTRIERHLGLTPGGGG